MSRWDGDGAPDFIDCDPADAAVRPAVDDPFGEGVDTNCDGQDGVDADQDGAAGDSGGGSDCDDSDAAVRPDATEVADNDIDENCDGVVLHCDRDGDSVLAAACGGADCDDTDGSCQDASDCLDVDADTVRRCDGDCDDTTAARSPINAELCDGVDGDCDGQVPTDERDGDADTVPLCAGDCDDTDASRAPLFAEVCDGRDNDCDAVLPSDEVDADSDLDPTCSDCDDSNPALDSHDNDGDGLTLCAGDCDDGDAGAFPGAADGFADGVDQNCDGADGVDGDGDGLAQLFLDCDDGSALCTDDCGDADGDGARVCDGDCVDTDPTASPTAPAELCDGLDTNCDGTLPVDEVDSDSDGDPQCSDCDDVNATLDSLDADGDGESTCAGDCSDTDALLNNEDHDYDTFTPCSGDCSDFNSVVHPGAAEGCDGVDSDCDAVLPAVEFDNDSDGFLACSECDDSRAGSWPGAPEICDGVDGDCDGVIPAEEVDGDGDGYVGCVSWSGDLALLGGDCDDSVGTTYPGAPDGCNDVDDDCNGVVDDAFDLDGDGWCFSDCADLDPTIHPMQPWEDPNDGIDTDCDGQDPGGLAGATTTFFGPSYGFNLGHRMAAVGDVDGDGGEDIASLCYDATTMGVCVYSGLDLLDDSTALVPLGRIVHPGGTPSDPLAVGIGDLDGDGFGEVALGIPNFQVASVQFGALGVFSGADLVGGASLDLVDATFVVQGTNVFGGFGQTVLWLPDLDGDGFGELIVGDMGWDTNPAQNPFSNEGAMYRFGGAVVAAGGTVPLSSATSMVHGVYYNLHLGRLRALGDVDGDGLADMVAGGVVITGPQILAGGALYSSGGFGVSSVQTNLTVSGVPGLDGGPRADLLVNDYTYGFNSLAFFDTSGGLPSSGQVWTYISAWSRLYTPSGERCGNDALATGDFDGDGVFDVALGCAGEGGPTIWPSVWVVPGTALQGGGDLGSDDAIFGLSAPSPNADAGSSVVVADLDGDGVVELLVGSPTNSTVAFSGGAIHVLDFP